MTTETQKYIEDHSFQVLQLAGNIYKYPNNDDTIVASKNIWGNYIIKRDGLILGKITSNFSKTKYIYYDANKDRKLTVYLENLDYFKNKTRRMFVSHGKNRLKEAENKLFYDEEEEFQFDGYRQQIDELKDTSFYLINYKAEKTANSLTLPFIKKVAPSNKNILFAHDGKVIYQFTKKPGDECKYNVIWDKPLTSIYAFVLAIVSLDANVQYKHTGITDKYTDFYKDVINNNNHYVKN